jgi:hypothetical protein
MIWLPLIFETIACAKADDVRFRQSVNLVNFDGLIASLSRRQFQQLLFRSVVHLDLEHRKLNIEIPCPFLSRFKRRKYRLHPAIDLQAIALGHHKVSACDPSKPFHEQVSQAGPHQLQRAYRGPQFAVECSFA